MTGGDCECKTGNPWDESSELKVGMVAKRDLRTYVEKNPNLYFVQYKCANCGARYFGGFTRGEACPDTLGFGDEQLACPVCDNSKGWLKDV